MKHVDACMRDAGKGIEKAKKKTVDSEYDDLGLAQEQVLSFFLSFFPANF